MYLQYVGFGAGGRPREGDRQNPVRLLHHSQEQGQETGSSREGHGQKAKLSPGLRKVRMRDAKRDPRAVSERRVRRERTSQGKKEDLGVLFPISEAAWPNALFGGSTIGREGACPGGWESHSGGGNNTVGHWEGIMGRHQA